MRTSRVKKNSGEWRGFGRKNKENEPKGNLRTRSSNKRSHSKVVYTEEIFREPFENSLSPIKKDPKKTVEIFLLDDDEEKKSENEKEMKIDPFMTPEKNEKKEKKSQSTVPSKKRGEHLSESMTESHAESKTGEFEEIRRRPVSKDTKKNAPRRQGRLETSESAESESEMIEEKLHKPTLTKKVKEQASKPSTKKPKEKSTSERIAMAKQALLESTVPANLLGREEECHEIQKFLKDALKNKGMPETLYISGTPGIGKTACCLRELEKFCSAHKNEVVQIYMNGLHMSHPENTYSYILKELTGIGNLSVAASANALGTPHFKLLFLPFIH
jgi:signal recognition particle GTPase